MRPAITLLSLLLLPAALSAADSDTAFIALARDFTEGYLERNPEQATWLGDHRFDHRLSDYSPHALAERAAFYRRTLSQLAAIDANRLSAPARLDADVLRLNLEWLLFTHEELREWESNPMAYNYATGQSLFLLMARDFASPAERLELISGRLSNLPVVLDQAKANLRQPSRMRTETATRQVEGMISLISRDLEPLIREAGAAPEGFAVTRQRAVEALTSYRDWLQSDLLPRSTGDFRLGPDLYRRQLAFTVGTAFTRVEILARAEQEMARITDAMTDTAGPLFDQYFPGQPRPADRMQLIRVVLDRQAEKHSDDDTILENARSILTRITSFVREHDLVTVPDTPLQVVLMPEFRRGLAMASCWPPGTLEPNGRTFYFIAPPPADWSHERRVSYYREYNDILLQDLTMHEAMPGHYLQFAHANQAKAPTLIRSLFASDTFMEGWAVYSEKMMVDQGYGGCEVRLQQLKYRLRAVINALLDQKIHAGTMTEAEAIDLMTIRGFQERGEAEGKWRRACLSSGQLSSYFVGAIQFDDLRSAAEAAEGPAFNLKRFHDRVLSFGSVPIELVSKAIDRSP